MQYKSIDKKLALSYYINIKLLFLKNGINLQKKKKLRKKRK